MNFRRSLFKLHLAIAFEQKGNYTKITDMMRRSGILTFSSDKFFSHNLLLSMYLQGVLDLVWVESGIVWYVNERLMKVEIDDDLVVAEDLVVYKDPISKITSRGHTLAFGKTGSAPRYHTSVNNLSSLGDITDSILFEELAFFASNAEMEVYSMTEHKWTQENDALLQRDSSLVRYRETYSGYKYYILLGHVRKAYRVLEPEWFFVVGAYVANFDFQKIVSYDGSNLKVPASFRLPAILSRYLFSNSETVDLGYMHEYKSVSEATVEQLFDFLMPGRIV